MSTTTTIEPAGFAHFLTAQDGGVYERALDEIRAGAKTSHWMWFVFPQIAGLGASPMAQRYAIQSLDEAKDYLAHELLGWGVAMREHDIGFDNFTPQIIRFPDYGRFSNRRML